MLSSVMYPPPYPASPVEIEQRYENLLAALRLQYPGFKIVAKKDSRLHRAIDVVVRFVTFGHNKDYLEGYTTTIGKTIYVTSAWETMPVERRYMTLRHEAEHVRQFDTYGIPLMAVLYVFLPLPAGLAWFRSHFEKQGYAESIRAAAEVYGLDYVKDPAYRKHIVDQFTTGSYGWMWPFRRSVETWYDGVVRGLEGA